MIKHKTFFEVMSCDFARSGWSLLRTQTLQITWFSPSSSTCFSSQKERIVSTFSRCLQRARRPRRRLLPRLRMAFRPSIFSTMGDMGIGGGIPAVVGAFPFFLPELALLHRFFLSGLKKMVNFQLSILFQAKRTAFLKI